MAKYILQRCPELLLGGDPLHMAENRCKEFWNNFKQYQPWHAVFQHHSELSTVIPICMHGDKGRTLKKSPIAVFSWESVWGLPEDMRNTPDERFLKKRCQDKHDHGRMGQPCSERPLWKEDALAAAACTIKRRHLSKHGNDKVQTHNSLGILAWFGLFFHQPKWILPNIF